MSSSPSIQTPTPRYPSTTSEMSSKRSSRELSAAAIDNDRKSREAAERKRKLQAQILVLQEQERLEEEKEKRTMEQADIDRQAAKNQGFHEHSLAKQAQFRSLVAPEVFTRVAHNIKSKEDQDYVAAIAEGKEDFDVTVLKLMLWDAIAGDHPGFLLAAATAVSGRVESQITDQDLMDIDASTACLTTAADATSMTAADLRPVSQAAIATQEETPPPVSVPGEQAPVAASDPEDPQAVNQRVIAKAYSPIKSESSPTPGDTPLKRRTMNEIEDEEGMPDAPTVDSSNEDEEEVLTSSAAGLLDPDSRQLQQEDTASPRSSPVAASVKRARDEDSQVFPAASPKTPKRLRTAASVSDKSPLGKYTRQIQELAENGILQEDAFKCVKCHQRPVNPRIASKCLHVYCNKCLTALRDAQGMKGKDATKVKCCSSGCRSATGTGSKIEVSDIELLRKKYEDDVVAEESGHGDDDEEEDSKEGINSDTEDDDDGSE